MKKIVSVILLVALATTVLAGCMGGASGFDMSKPINVISREEGSGTRGAFIELFGIEVKGADGKKTDKTTSAAAITNNTSVMMTSVSGDAHSVGYISLGSLNDTVKAVSIDGVVPSTENVKNGTYKVARPFLVATKDNQSNETKDFIAFILSKEGQSVIEKNGYIKNESDTSYTASNITGKITVAGSSSVTPVMEKLAEEYKKLNPKAAIEIQQSDSSSGMTSAIDGICDIGMASRQLNDGEKSKGLKSQVIATDGICLIVNKACSIESLTKDQVKNIFTGITKTWSELSK